MSGRSFVLLLFLGFPPAVWGAGYALARLTGQLVLTDHVLNLDRWGRNPAIVCRCNATGRGCYRLCTIYRPLIQLEEWLRF
jgi:hypothetical protein